MSTTPASPFPSDITDAARAWAQVVIRDFASATNLLVPGRTFLLVPPTGAEAEAARPFRSALVASLRGMGAHVRLAGTGQTDHSAHPHPQALVRLHPAHVRATDFPPLAAGTVTVDAPLPPPSSPGDAHPAAARPLVRREDGHVLHDPHHPGAGEAPARLAWAREHMPVTRKAVRHLAERGLLTGRRVGLSLVLEPKTAVLARELADAGAEVVVFGHADETRTDVAEALREAGLSVHAEADASPEREEELAREFLSHRLEFLLDDGSHLIRMAHDARRAPGALESMVGAAEETTSGLRPLREWEREGRLAVPVIASNDARSKTLFDNAYGTGQSCLLTALDLLDPQRRGWPLWRQEVLVLGYGDVGRGLARLAAGLGARVCVAEIDPVRRLQALMDGHEVGDARHLAARADVVVSATGVARTIDVGVLEAMHDGAVAFVAGGVVDEIDLTSANARGMTLTPVAEVRTVTGDVDVRDAVGDDAPLRAVESLHVGGGRRVLVLDRGGCLNCTAGEGNPIEIMDLSFGVQVGALTLLVKEGARLAPGLHPLSAEADTAVAAAALTVLAAPDGRQ